MRGITPQERICLVKCQGITTVHSNGDVYVPEDIRLQEEDMAVLPLLIAQGRVFMSEELMWNNVVLPVYTITSQGTMALQLDKTLNNTLI